MELSIIIVNYNTSKLTSECVDSIKKYPPETDYEIIIIDNGSEEKLSINGNGIKIIRNEKNLGFSKANNQGIDAAKGKYVLLLNSDTTVKKNSISSLLKFAQENNDAAVVAPKLLNTDGSIQPSVFRLPTLWLIIRQYWFGEKGLLDKYVPKTNTVEEAVMAAYLITPTCFKKVGKLNERYFFFFEDFDYARRIKEKGLKIYYLSDAEIVHHHGASGKKVADESNQWRRLIPGSKIYHGILTHYLIIFVMWSSQKWRKLLNQN